MSRVKDDFADHLKRMEGCEECMDERRGPVSEEDLQRMYEEQMRSVVSGKAR